MYEEWAKQLLNELYYVNEDKRVDLLRDALVKAVGIGYVDGKDNSWWKERPEKL